MVMDAGLHDVCTLLPGSKRDVHLPIYPQIAAANGFTAEQFESLLFLSPDAAAASGGGGGGGYLNGAAPLISVTSTNGPSPPRGVPVSAAAVAQAHPDDSEVFSDIVLGYIDRMLMAEDIDEKIEHSRVNPADLLAAEKPFLEILADQSPYSGTSSVESPDSSSVAFSCNSLTSCNCGAVFYGLSGVPRTPVLQFPTAAILETPQLYGDLSPDSGMVEAGNTWPYTPAEFYQLQANPGCENLLSQSPSFASSNGSNVPFSEGFESLLSPAGFMPDAGRNDFVVQSQQAMQFRRGLQDASRFLPHESNLVIDVDKIYNEDEGGRLLGDVRQEKLLKLKTEITYLEAAVNRGKKHFCGDDLDAVEGRCTKHSSPGIDIDHIVREMMDMVLLCNGDTCARGVKELREALQHEVAKHSGSGHGKGSNHGKGRGKKQPKKEVVDLETLLIHCAQSVAIDDRRSATELLKQIRQHAHHKGDGDQRLAYCFANGLEARLAGTGSRIYKEYTMIRSCTDELKAYQLYLAACPFKKISHYFANQTIINAVEKAKKVHIIDYGINYGFQWPCLIHRLSKRTEGAPKLRITGIDTPQPGFRPAGRTEETGRYLSDYARSFDVPFEYQAIASHFEAVRMEDLRIEDDEILIVNCMFKFKNLMDESVVAESPRNMTLKTIRKMNPHLFINGVVNGSYNAPFFVTRFREALFHYSAIFDMLETNIPRDNEQRLLIESTLFSPEAINVISCEGLERMERPETYKQWQIRHQRAGFKQLPLNQDMMKRSRDKVKCYHKDFIIDEDNRQYIARC
ncbi:hypothetical protein GUJ93_ZPchr0001g30344 [Zizania palustris]|uniref:Scarecrow-like protein 9 n=1 Tax=Zizania palustris TaxID=103762 RepID=A0A8J5VP97_ZIZPA|nr:hypothetical protein GUJ93_ZPchr0001g30344 [Zizania palustris]